METPTISKKQKKSTLSGKKTKPKDTIKNVVATPYKNSYWPQITPDDHEMLKVFLKNNLPKIKPPENNIPWNVLKNIPKPDRKRIRNEYRKNDDIIKEDRNGFILGINDVTKLLEKNSISAILIASDVQPRIMVQHIIDEAVLYRVPIIVFDDLRRLLSKICGVTSAVVGISKNIDSQSKLNSIAESVKQVFEKYPPPLNHINYQRSVSSTLEDSQPVKDNSAFSKNEKPNVTETENTNESSLKLESEIYLKRDSNSKRVFVPESSTENVKVHRMEVVTTGFVPFLKTSTPIIENQQVKANYRSLIVRRLKGDPNRNKRKIASLKRKLEK